MVNIDKLKGMMTEKKVTQAMLADATGLDISTINRKLKTGEDFTIEQANKIVSRLELTRDEAIIIFFGSTVA